MTVESTGTLLVAAFAVFLTGAGLAVAALVRLLRDEGGGLLAAIGLAAFASGCLAFLVSLVFGLTATPRAAAETVRTSAVPLAYQTRHRLANALYVSHILLSYAAFAVRTADHRAFLWAPRGDRPAPALSKDGPDSADSRIAPS